LRIVNRAGKAFIIGGAFVGIVKVLGHYRMATPIPFFLLIAGIATGAFVPDSGFNLKGMYILGARFPRLLFTR
jgi:hypothetical protein